MAVDIIARAMAAKALKEGGGGLDDTLQVGKDTVYEVGGIPAGTNLDGMTLEQILIKMLYGDGAAVPTLTDPSLKAVLNGYYAVAGSNTAVTGVATFDRGSIVPAYGTSGYRSGMPTSYVINGASHETSVLSYSFSTNFQAVHGDNTITVTVNFAEGEQPKDGTGANYDSPYPAGSMSVELTVVGTYPVYATNTNGDLEAMDVQNQFNEDGMLEVQVPEELIDDNKQAVALSSDVTDPIVGIQQYDNVQDKWLWIFGTPEKSLETFDVTETTIDVNGEQVVYKVYTNNLTRMGPRKLRFFTKLPTE